ncbi:MAG TPA: metalloregulator ArsR/SmtB family transcription factor [Rhizomicrobium sp.]
MLVISDSARPNPVGRVAVLDLLKRHGPISADALAGKIGITGMAVRQQLQALEDRGLAAHERKVQARGRPVKLWRATTQADSLFTDSHSLLAVDVLAQMRKAFGEKGLDRLLRMRTAEQEKMYRAKTDPVRTLRAKLEALATLRSAEGYMAEVRREPATGAWLFIENHCPICTAARMCQGLCREELALFRRVLGSVKIERLSHIMTGAGRCTYRVAAA